MEFAKDAAKHFAENPSHSSYGDIKPGSLIALRWGLVDDCVLVLKLNSEHIPVNYQQLIKTVPAEETAKKEGDECPF